MLWLDLEHADKNRPKSPLDRSTDCALLEREGAIGNRAVDHAGLGDSTQIDVFFRLAQLFCDFLVARALRDPLGCLLSRFHARKRNLLDVTTFRGHVACTALLIGAMEIGVGDFDPLRLLGRNERHQRQFSVFGRAEQVFAFLEIFRKDLGSGRRNVTS